MAVLADRVRSVAELFLLRAEVSRDVEAHRIKKAGQWHPVTWGEVGDRVNAMAGGLAHLGFGQADTVAILGETCPEWCVADLAGIVLGGQSVGIYPTLLEDQIQFILADAAAKVLFVQGAEQFERMQPMLDAVESLEHSLSLAEEMAVRETLAELYEGRDEYEHIALANHRRLLVGDVGRVASLSAIARATAADDPLRAHVMFQALHLLRGPITPACITQTSWSVMKLNPTGFD